MKISPEKIQTQEFTKALRGFDEDEVKEFLERLSIGFKDLMDNNETLKNEISELKTSLDGYIQIEKDLQAKILEVQNSSKKSIEGAKEQTESMLKEAEVTAAGLIDKAKENANEIRDAVINLREEKNLIISKLKAMVNTQSTLLEGKVIEIDKEQQVPEKTTQQKPKDDLDVDVDGIVNKLL